ncbi:acyl-CoA oxidase [Thozetella sp. PMI_491]|nr:acyl-CoA oxidase [Thozetella sp. PMI_491]
MVLNEKLQTNRQIALMTSARLQTTIDIQTLTSVIYGDAETMRNRREAWARVEAATGAADTTKLPLRYAYTSREDLYMDGLTIGTAAWNDGHEYGHQFFDWLTPRYTLMNYSPFGLTVAMFAKMLELMGTPEQQKKWLIPARKGLINGAFVQTELGHGSFVRGLETTATFDVTRDCFILNSPTTTSTKYWPGALGFSASHGIIMARLITDKKDHGVHPFMLQLRDIETGMPTPGVELGDVGLKPSHNQNDNGYAIFTNVAIPRENMLMGQSRVSREGKYSKVPGTHPKASYATMMSVRANIVWVCAVQLAGTVTIATRYSIVREQGSLPFQEEEPSPSCETSIMNYKSQQYRLLTRLAQAYAILFASERCKSVHAEFESKQAAGDFSTMADAHQMSAGMKAWASAVASEGAEDARKCCGGAGYLVISGLPELVYSLTALCTLEGENYVLWQQTARFLVQRARSTMLPDDKAEAAVPESLRYLAVPRDSRCGAAGNDFLMSSVQLDIFRHRAQRLVLEAAARFSNDFSKSPPKSRAELWNDHAMTFISAAKSHIEYIVLEEFVRVTQKIQDPTVAKVLTNLCSLFTLSTMTSPLSSRTLEFVEDGFLSSRQMNEIRDLVNGLLQDLLPEMCGLTDAWDFTDAGLGSAIGMKNGNAYETLLRWTRQLPMNAKARQEMGVHEGWAAIMRPALSSRL